jgi:hypothetical protein
MTAQGRTTFTLTTGQPTLAGPFVYFPLYILVAEERITTKNLLTVLLFYDIWGTRRCRRDHDARPILDTVVLRSDEERNNVHQNRFKN